MALLRVDPGLVIWLWITFGIILLILRLTVWDRITGGLDKRSQRIATDLDAARKAGEKAGAVLAEYDQKIREGKAEAARIIEEARMEASRLKEDILRQSQEEAREVKERAAQEIAEGAGGRGARAARPGGLPLLLHRRLPSSSGRPAARTTGPSWKSSPRSSWRARLPAGRRRPQLRAG